TSSARTSLTAHPSSPTQAVPLSKLPPPKNVSNRLLSEELALVVSIEYFTAVYPLTDSIPWLAIADVPLSEWSLVAIVVIPRPESPRTALFQLVSSERWP